ncbi:phospholipase D-like domain-containing protein [Guptibacillus hwajinpoensis]|uniref:phospholipase D-like domain-containing protein n=1 Tax=Guptibacillus hwajinpoensis TaxID=208199 RepID=UPI001CFCC1FE|nr:phospholipase D-like domain-containing protein [Pseudalkalibacillus hwajinpoensis]WLR60174.1 phospholipase D-like domain-containing protein [Pseudalkalibacillus hwajinpoensis]
MPYKAFFDMPLNHSIKHIRGSSPYLLDQLIKEIGKAKEIKVSFFLYNNPFLHEALENIAHKGCKVIIYSLPLNGYTKQEVKISNPEKSRLFVSSKYEYALKTYRRVFNRPNNNIEIKIFPHTYRWFKPKYSRGDEPYSLHTKNIWLLDEDGKEKFICLSCNLAFADQQHSENMLVIEDERNAKNMYKIYFELLENWSLSLKQYINYSKQKFDFEYIVKPINLKDTFNDTYFTAPFICYENKGSNHYVQEKIIQFINSASKDITICSQHFMDIDSFDSNADSIIEHLYKKVTVEKHINLKILKQTRANHQSHGKRTKLAEEKFSQLSNVEQRYWSPVVHDKFIIVDDKLLISTANFTATQFAWSDQRQVSYEVGDRDIRVSNCFSEVNAFHFIEDVELKSAYLDHFNELWKHSTTITF